MGDKRQIQRPKGQRHRRGAAADPSVPALPSHSPWHPQGSNVWTPAHVGQPTCAPRVRQALQLSCVTQGYNHSKDVKRRKLMESDATCGLLKQSQQTQQLRVSQALEVLGKSHIWLCLLLQSRELPTTPCPPKHPSGCSAVSHADVLPSRSFRPEPARCLSPEVPLHPAAAGHTSTLPVTRELGRLLPL